ncbi:threonylcarbamoyl-AMP synthase Sua [Gottschalkia purinilytica]|uniref:Threonylcarbamoyl-AMP synthase n=1 Tax=Gottschalkia purinilytica TaxID=1503 RepID=A0A0L0WE31_GOTPU|nr:L-threonylcarbamoyladenylate synthase [Gottschalkia purinilytica]KNF09729.1 threonylcarbamoyl-AMP synthase Sua [Gottschalkia purinilytica]
MNNKVTKIIELNNGHIEEKAIKEAGEVIKNGGLVAFPTETVYGLGANALDEDAVGKIFEAKGRPQDNPLIVHIGDISQIYELVEEVPEKALMLMEKFWPGPLTLLFNKNEKVPLKTTGGLQSVAIRMPKNEIAIKLINESKVPIAAPSANLSGKPSPTNASHVIEDLLGKIDIIIDGGTTGVGVESTVLDISTDIPTILRPGGVTLENLLTVFPKVEYDPALESKDKDLVPKSPGQKYKHYSPKANMKIVYGTIEDMSKKINELKDYYTLEGMKVGILATSQTKEKYDLDNTLVLGDRENLESIASNLFDMLRKFDKLEVDIILSEGFEEKGIGKAIMNRMKKAAGGDIIYLD